MTKLQSGLRAGISHPGSSQTQTSTGQRLFIVRLRSLRPVTASSAPSGQDVLVSHVPDRELVPEQERQTWLESYADAGPSVQAYTEPGPPPEDVVVGLKHKPPD